MRAHLDSTLSKHTQRKLSLSQLLDTIRDTGGLEIGTLTHLSQVNLQFLSISSSLRIQNRVRGKMREEVEFQGILRRPHLPPAPGYAREAPPPSSSRAREKTQYQRDWAIPPVGWTKPKTRGRNPIHLISLFLSRPCLTVAHSPISYFEAVRMHWNMKIGFQRYINYWTLLVPLLVLDSHLKWSVKQLNIKE